MNLVAARERRVAVVKQLNRISKSMNMVFSNHHYRAWIPPSVAMETKVQVPSMRSLSSPANELVET